jgi:hypothetical protein
MLELLLLVLRGFLTDTEERFAMVVGHPATVRS